MKKKYLCVEHFKDVSFINSTKHKLVHNAVPIPYKDTFPQAAQRVSNNCYKNCLQTVAEICGEAENPHANKNHWLDDSVASVIKPNKTYGKESGFDEPQSGKHVNTANTINTVNTVNETEDLQNFYCSPAKQQRGEEERKNSKRKNLFGESCASPRKKKIIHLYRQKLKEVRQKTRQIKYLKKKVEKYRISYEKVPDFIKTQMGKTKIKKWSQPMRDMAVSIYYASPVAYKCLRKNKVKMPGVSTIKRWLNSFDLYSGFSEDVLNKIKSTASAMSKKQRMCILSFDELSIKKQLDYNKSRDIIEGLFILTLIFSNDDFNYHHILQKLY